MAKDPAFLFYTKDFYEGTRTMLPEERACYIDLLIYQHQNGGFIPNEPKRILMYCSGCSEATLKATLKAKFKLTEFGWINEVLDKVMKERENFSGRQKINGTVGQFFKKSKAILSAKDFFKLREVFENQSNDEIFNKIQGLEINEATLKAMLVAMLQAKHKHLEDAIGNANGIEDLNDIKEIKNFENFQKNSISESQNFESKFDEFRKLYPGTKNGLNKEFKNFQKHRDWADQISKLIPALKTEIDWRANRKMKGQFVAEWKHLQTWINGRCWEQELESVEVIKSKLQIQDEAIAKGMQNLLTKIENSNADLRPLEIAAVNS